MNTYFLCQLKLCQFQAQTPSDNLLPHRQSIGQMSDRVKRFRFNSLFSHRTRLNDQSLVRGADRDF